MTAISDPCLSDLARLHRDSSLPRRTGLRGVRQQIVDHVLHQLAVQANGRHVGRIVLENRHVAAAADVFRSNESRA